MTALQRVLKEKPIPTSFWPLSLLALVGIGLSIYRLAVGLGPTTNLSDHYPWGLWISLDLFLIPVAGAAFTMSLITYFFGRRRYETVIRPAVVAGFLGYGVVAILLFLDIGRWPQFYNIFNPRFINYHSFLEEVSLCITLYTVILVLEMLPILLERSGAKVPLRFIHNSIFYIAGLGIVLSALHQSSLGSLFLLMPSKLHPLWYTPALPLLFLLQSVVTGLATTAIAISLIWRSLNIPLDRLLFRRLGQAMSVALAFYAALKLGDTMGAGEIDLLLKPDAFGLLAWLEIGVGTLIPMAILFSRLVSHEAGPFWAGVFVLMGTLINRLVVSWIGLSEPTLTPYVPSLIEILITVGLLAGGLLLYGIVVRYFPILPQGGDVHD